jgi:NADPH:quinone reductase-like Zn-dependent oxidoreductase
MRASLITETGGLDVIEVQEVSEPTVGPEDVLVDVGASAVNHTDVWIRRGFEGDPPVVTGIDVAGTVTEVGADVTALDVGDRVVVYYNTDHCGECEFCHDGETTLCLDYGGLGVSRDGGHAERIAVAAEFAVSIPDDLSFAAAASVPSNFGTAWRGLVTRADVAPGEDVLVLGASGGVGHGAVQIAEHAGATVYAATSSDEKAAKLRELGADHTIDYTERDLNDAIRNHTDGRGVDVVFDSIGGETYKEAIRSLVRGGRLVTIGATAGDADEAMLHHVFWKQLEVVGATGCTQGEFEDMLRAVFDGDVRPVVDEVIPLEDIPRAHERLSNRDVFGKIVVEP